MARSIAVLSAVSASVLLTLAASAFAQEPPPLFFREDWQQTSPVDPSTGLQPSLPVTPAALTNPNLELRLYDPGVTSIASYAQNPPARSNAADWTGPSCVILAGGGKQNPRKAPPTLWNGICQTPVAVTLRDTTNYVDLTGLAKVRWVTRVSGFHLVRPVIKLADGTWLVGDYADGANAIDAPVYLESEFPIASIRWRALDIARVVTTGTWVEKPDLSRVDEIGFADLMPGSGHGFGGFINFGRIEVYGKTVKR